MDTSGYITDNNIENIDEMREKADNYLTALAQIYDEIFEFDLKKGTVSRVYGQFFDILSPKQTNVEAADAVFDWIEKIVFEEDRDNVKAAFKRFFSISENTALRSGPIQIEFSAKINDETKVYLGVFLAMKKNTFLFCCCDVINMYEADKLKRENTNLRDLNNNMREIVKHFTDGMLAFKMQNEIVTPLYISDNICDFFGFNTEEWIFMMNEGLTVNDFIARSNFSYEDFQNLMREGEAEFDYTDVESGDKKRIRAVSTIYFDENGPAFYIMLQNAADKSREKRGNTLKLYSNADAESGKNVSSRVYIRTFGYFDVFVDGKPIAFRNKKSKELLALLVDRRGGFVSSSEAINFLWEDEPANKTTLSRYRKVALRLKNFLEEYGIENIIETVDGKRRIVPEAVRCDFYDYLADSDGNARTFNGSYILNYSWAETTLGELLIMSGKIFDKENY